MIEKTASHGIGDREFLDCIGETVYVSDTHNHRVQKFTTDGRFLAELTGFGMRETSSSASPSLWDGFLFPSSAHIPMIEKTASHGIGDREFLDCIGVTVDMNGNVYVVDAGMHRLAKYDKEGQLLHQWGKFGGGPGQFWTPLGVDVDKQGNVYVADSGNHRIQKFTSEGVFITEFGSFGSDNGELNFPIAIAVSSDGNTVYVADTMNNRVQIFKKAMSQEPPQRQF
jgi:tripartite motif-containing protein 71